MAQQANETLVLLSLVDGTYFSLNEVGSHVWSLCDGTHTLSAVVDKLCSEFDADREVVERDVLALVDELAAERLLAET